MRKLKRMKMLTVKRQWKLAWRAARRLTRRMTYSWPQDKSLAMRHYNKKYCEEIENLPVTVTIRSAICYFDRVYWQDQSVRRWLKSNIRRKLP